MKQYISVYDAKCKTYIHRKELYDMGLRFKKTSKYKGKWIIITDDKKLIDDIKDFCKQNELKCTAYDENLVRSSDYRKVFLQNMKPIYHDYYICAYCLLPHKIENITVDHIIPIQKVQTSSFYRKLMKHMHIENVNDQKNLTPACLSCNSKKGHKGGLWIIRGFLGKKRMFLYTVLILLILWMILISILLFEEVMK